MSAGDEPVPCQNAPGQNAPGQNAPGPAGVGADLRAARLRLGWGLQDISAWLRIRLQYLEALEERRIADMPGTTCAIGFLRTYGSTLGLDADELARRFRQEALPASSALAFPAPVSQRGVPVGAVVLISVGLAIGAYVGWYRLSGAGRLPAEVVSPVPARLAPLADQAIPPSVPPKPAAPAQVAAAAQATPPPAPAPTQAPAPADNTANASTLAISPSVAAAMSLPAQPPPAPAATPDNTAALPTAPATAPTAAPPPAAAPPANPDESRITLRATANNWVQVRDKSTGQVLFNRMMHASDTWAVPPKPNLFLMVGNAGRTDILVDGNLVPSIGKSGVVRHDVPLDPDVLRDGKTAVPATPVAANSTAQASTPKPTPQ